MRTMVKYTAWVLVLSLFLLGGAPICSAAEEYPYSDLFLRAAETEEYDDDIGGDLSDAFDDDPAAFINALTSEESESKWKIIDYLLTAKGERLPELLETLLQAKVQLGTPSGENLPQREIIGDIIASLVYRMEPDCAALFSLAGHTDGYVAESFSVALGKAFAASPEQFVELLACEDAQAQDEIVGLLVFDRYYFDNENFCSTLEQMRQSDWITDGELAVIQMILAEVDRQYQMNHPPETQPAETEPTPPETVPTTEATPTEPPQTEPVTTAPDAVPTEPTVMPQEETTQPDDGPDGWTVAAVLVLAVLLGWCVMKRRK